MRKAFVFDFDDTLATTDCYVRVYRDCTFVCKLTPTEFNNYKLNKHEHFCFIEFERLINPKATWLLPLAQEISQEDQSVYILTARGQAASEGIYKWLKDNGIFAKQIHCIGDTDGEIAQEKRKIIMTILEGYDKVYFYDDHSGNIDSMPVSSKLRKYKIS